MIQRALLWTLAGLVVIVLAWLAWIAGHIAWWKTHPPHETAFMEQRMDTLRATNPHAVVTVSAAAVTSSPLTSLSARVASG